jgi:tetratricopeptide (TPR) repeat protein
LGYAEGEIAMLGKVTVGLKIILPVILSLLWLTPGYAQPLEPLSALVVRLQQTPQDDALRQQVIRRAREMLPEPTIPTEVQSHESLGYALLGKAKTQQDYLAAMREFQQALRLAPWVARLYFGLGETFEKMSDGALAEQAPGRQPRQFCISEKYDKERWLFDRARENFEFFLLAEVNISEEDTARIKHRIAVQQLRSATWKYRWDTECCLGCGGKQDSIR